MGYWTYTDAVDKKNLGYDKKLYLLIPQELGGGVKIEPYWDGYGRFGGEDIHEILFDYNRGRVKISKNVREGFLSKHGEAWDMYEAGASDEELDAYFKAHFDRKSSLYDEWKRNMGIELDCSDDDPQMKLAYVLKITRHKDSTYESACFRSINVQ